MKPSDDTAWSDVVPDPFGSGAASKEPSPLDPRERGRRQYRLNQLMLLSVVFALIFYFIARAVRSGAIEDVLMAVVAVSVAVLSAGVVVIQRSAKSSWGGWALVILGLVGVCGISLTWFSVVFIVIMLVSISNLLASHRAVQQDALLWSLALAADREMPLGPSVRAFADQLSGGYRKRARALADCLDNGMPLPDALEFVDRATDPRANVLARVGWDAGALPEALRTATTGRTPAGRANRDFASRVSYLSMLLVVIQLVIGFVMYFIMPKFEAIFKDFGTPLSPVTVITIQASHFLSRFGAFPLLLVCEVAFLIYLPFALNGWQGLSVPFFDRLFVRRHRLLILKALALVARRGQPIGLGILSLSRAYPTPWVRRRLVTVWRGMESGLGWADALRSVGLLSDADAEVMVSAERAGNLNWALAELADAGEKRYARRLDMATQLIFALVLFATGALVGVLAVAYFVPLVDLISKLAG